MLIDFNINRFKSCESLTKMFFHILNNSELLVLYKLFCLNKSSVTAKYVRQFRRSLKDILYFIRILSKKMEVYSTLRKLNPTFLFLSFQQNYLRDPDMFLGFKNRREKLFRQL